MTTITIPEQRLTVPNLGLQDRAVILRSLAERWDSLIDSFIEWDRTNTRLLEVFIRNMICPYVHETVQGAEIPDGMRVLAEQCKALDDYRTLGTVPASLDEAEAYSRDPEALVALMETDIDLQLFWLLHGPDTQPCSRCKRLNAYVWTWGVADWPASVYCTPCREVVAR